MLTNISRTLFKSSKYKLHIENCVIQTFTYIWLISLQPKIFDLYFLKKNSCYLYNVFKTFVSMSLLEKYIEICNYVNQSNK